MSEGIVILQEFPFEPKAPEFSDEALALEFAERAQGEFRYVPIWRRWMHFDGQVWREDDTLAVFREVRQLCREAAEACNGERQKKALASVFAVAAVERLGRSDLRLVATVGQWDRDRWLLNTPGGVIDLRSGKLRAHDPLDYMTKITAAAPEGECPLWLSVLDRAMGGDLALIRFLQRMFGYCLSGDVSLHVLFFALGFGANSKSVIVNTVLKAMGDYAIAAPVDMLTVSTGDRHPTELALLRGARLVVAMETERGRTWAEAKIKALTGGDPIVARGMRQDFFTYDPQFKLVVTGNHVPSLGSVDEANRRRLHIIPFDVTIPVDERDPDLPEKLRAEFGGILNWCKEGSLACQREGLGMPDAVHAASAAYMEDEDAVGTWLAACCESDRNARTPSSVLFGSWKRWAEANNAPEGNPKTLTQALKAKGFEIHRPHGSVVVGLRMAAGELDFGCDKP